MSGPRARLFLALDLPEPARASLASWRDTLVADRSDLRPVSPEALHVTLVFLGWQDESAAPKIADAAFGALSAGRPPRLTPVGVRSLPPRNPRLLALDLEDEGGAPPRCRRPRRLRSRQAAGTAPRSVPSGHTSPWLE